MTDRDGPGREPGDADGASDASGREVVRRAAHKTLKIVTGEYEAFKFNTMVAHLIELTNTLMRYRGTPVAGTAEWDEAVRLLLLMLAPAAPHITEELWSRQLAAGTAWTSIHQERWPDVDQAAATDETREVPVQVNGKLRDRVIVQAGMDQAELERLVLGREKVAAALAGRTPDKVIHAGGGRLVNIVVR
jgi:leucyl-tRNA synthetase